MTPTLDPSRKVAGASLREWMAEVALVGLGLALAYSANRLFTDTSAVRTLMVVAVAAWGVALATRRLPTNDLGSSVIFLAFGMWVILYATVPETFSTGLPTTSSFTEVASLVRGDMTELRTEVAPVPPGGGHLVLLGALIWAAAGYVSSAAMTLRLLLWAPVPHVVAIVAIGLLAREEGRLAASAAMLAALAAYFATQLEWKAERIRWVHPDPSITGGALGSPPRRGMLTRVSLLALAALMGLGGQATFFSDPDPAIDYRQGGGNNTTNVVSPFVEIEAYLNGAGRDSLLFTALTTQASYWRLTALDEYEAQSGTWILSNSYNPTDGRLADPSESDQAMTVTIESLRARWVPGPNDPVTVSTEVALGWDADAGSLYSMERDLEAEDTFDFGAADLPGPEEADRAVAEADPVLLDTSGVSPEAQQFIDAMWSELGIDPESSAGGVFPYQSALAAQDWIRANFSYDETIDLRGSADPLSEFLAIRRGFCQQFSTYFALAMRSIGVPSRVVVGFTPGEPTEDLSGGESGGGKVGVSVYGRQAHAWPEIKLDDVGWIPFEPTPGRGNPAAEQLTGVPPAQTVGPDLSRPSPPTTVPTTTAPEMNTTTVPATPREPTVTVSGGGSDTAGPPRWVPVALGVAVLALGGGVIWALLQRRRSAPPCESGDESVIGRQWRLVCASLAARGIQVGDSETPNEFARRAAAETTETGPTGTGPAESTPSGTGIHDLRALTDLADLESRRRWSEQVPGEQEETRAAELGARVIDTLQSVPETAGR